MKIHQNKSLAPFNTFAIDVKAEYFAEFSTPDELVALLRTGIRPARVMGGGSNLLLTQDLEGLTLRNRIEGLAVIPRTDKVTWVNVGAGVDWNRLTEWAVQNNLGGIENLSLIPGSVGAAPIQNIGAYGVELKDVFVSLKALDIETLKIRHFTRPACRFGYRDSLFKREAKGRFIILTVCLKLARGSAHRLKLDYGDIRRTLQAYGIPNPGIADVARAVIDIRRSKLPDPKVLPNSGSFFKNPEISATAFEALKKRYPQIPHYPAPEGRVKVPAGWLIEQCGWKGKRIGDAGCHERQALVLVNYGRASGRDILRLAELIQTSVGNHFGIDLEPEVNRW
ncbi:MAG: UDP-N-acetylmuramate dehydrogenase [Saprospiraceae bacterium]